MSPINIPPINSLNLQTKYGTLSNYAKKFIKPQIKSTSLALKRFLRIDLKLISENEQKLKELGIKQIGKDINEGVIISDIEHDYHVYSSNGKSLDLDILEHDTNQLCRHFKLDEVTDNYIHTGNFVDLSIEDKISKALDFAIENLLKATALCSPAKIPQPYITKQSTTDKIKRLNKAKHSFQKNIDTKNIGFIGSKEEEMIKSIKEKHLIIQELYKKISDLRTKYKVKSSYKNYLPQPVANKIGFKNIGPNGEAISLFQTSYKNNAFTAITITDINGKEANYVISQDTKSVQKNFPSKCVKSEVSGYRIYLTPKYYTPKEINEANIYAYLLRLNTEMDQFIKYTQDWFAKKEEKKLIKSNYDTATLDKYQELLDDIHSNFEKYQTKMRKFLRKPHKSRKFKTENNISTKLASIAVKFEHITPDGYDLRLSYPKVHYDRATQLLVMSGDKIEKSFYILNNKLLRFNIKDLNDKFSRYESKLYYYDNKYLKESNLHSYLLLLQEKLRELNKKLNAIRKKQLENRAKYHIKTSKEIKNNSKA